MRVRAVRAVPAATPVCSPVPVGPAARADTRPELGITVVREARAATQDCCSAPAAVVGRAGPPKTDSAAQVGTAVTPACCGPTAVRAARGLRQQYRRCGGAGGNALLLGFGGIGGSGGSGQIAGATGGAGGQGGLLLGDGGSGGTGGWSPGHGGTGGTGGRAFLIGVAGNGGEAGYGVSANGGAGASGIASPLQPLFTALNVPTEAVLGRPLIGNGANAAPGSGLTGSPGGLLLGDGGAGGSGTAGHPGGVGGAAGVLGTGGAGGIGGELRPRATAAPVALGAPVGRCWAMADPAARVASRSPVVGSAVPAARAGPAAC